MMLTTTSGVLKYVSGVVLDLLGSLVFYNEIKTEISVALPFCSHTFKDVFHNIYT